MSDPQSIALYQAELAECTTVVWNGPLGAFEIKPFDTGTAALARDVAPYTGREAAVGRRWRRHGGRAGPRVWKKFSYVSTAGGAFLEWMEGKALPGVAALIRAA